MFCSYTQRDIHKYARCIRNTHCCTYGPLCMSTSGGNKLQCFHTTGYSSSGKWTDPGYMYQHEQISEHNVEWKQVENASIYVNMYIMVCDNLFKY